MSMLMCSRRGEGAYPRGRCRCTMLERAYSVVDTPPRVQSLRTTLQAAEKHVEALSEPGWPMMLHKTVDLSDDAASRRVELGAYIDLSPSAASPETWQENQYFGSR